MLYLFYLSQNPEKKHLAMSSSCQQFVFGRRSKDISTFRSHVSFEPVSRTKLLNALIYLKANNPSYHDITIDVSEIPSDLISFLDEPIDFSGNTSSEEPRF